MWTALVWGTLVFAVFCCQGKTFDQDAVYINLRSGLVRGYNPYISFIQPPKTVPGKGCNKQVVLKIDFSGKYRGAKFLLVYGEPPKYWTLDISDSPTGDGYGGDNGTTSNMAEVQIHNKQMKIYGNDLPGHMDASSNGGLLIKTIDGFVKRGSKAKLDVSDERFEWRSRMHKDYLESKFLFTLSGQTPIYGRQDNFLYVGLNRVVGGSFRNGSGLCEVEIALYTYDGNACERGTHKCHADALCIPTRRRYRCQCKPGFYGTGRICVEKNECEYDNGGCVHFCDNTLGNYSCSCKNGFTLDTDGHNCIDENECLNNKGGCEHQCVNTLGGYECRCNQGYSLTMDGRTCQFGTWCQEKMGCEHFCHSPGGRIQCGCRRGYRLHTDGKQCIQTCLVGNGGCQHNCSDTVIGPVCSCAPEYIIRDDNRTCIASCQVNNGGCDKKCIDTKDGPRCACPRGYELHQDGRTCLDIDECEVSNGGCSHGCVNTDGGYECVCPKGFKVKPNQRICADIDECELNTTCDHECVNTAGSFYCRCRLGYQLYGSTHCADVNECSVDNGGCEQKCTNTEGSFQCQCEQGKKIHTNGKDCVPWNTCLPLPKPPKSLMTCSSHRVGEQVCNLSCEASSYPSIPHQTFTYFCGDNTGYVWSFDKLNQTLPFCSGEAKSPVIAKKARFVFLAAKCRKKRRLREDIRRNLTIQLNGQKMYKCRRMCAVNYVNIDCKKIPKKFRRLARKSRGEVVVAEMEIEIEPRSARQKCDVDCTRKRTERRLKKVFKKLKKAVNKKRIYLRYDRQDIQVAKKSLKTKKETLMKCKDASVLVDSRCLGCSIGTYFKRRKKQCVPCPPGTYQDQEGQMSCKACPNQIPGVGVVGATNITQCTVLCGPGTYSDTGRVHCLPCILGTYQSDFGRISCKPCDGGLTTRYPGSRSFQDCRAKVTCAAGYFYDIRNHVCTQCPVGTYQPKLGQNHCINCPGTTITDNPAATNQSECKNPICGGYIGDLQGFIESPNYPGNYPNNRECVWKIKPGKKRRILVIIPEVFLPKEDKCGDVLVFRKSKRPSSLTTYETCETREKPIAFTSRSRRMWIQFKSDGQNTAKGFSIPYVTYNEDYQRLIEDIVRDGRLYSSYQHQSILKDRKLLNILMEVIAQPYNYFNYANVSRTMMPESFINLLTSKVTGFFTSEK